MDTKIEKIFRNGKVTTLTSLQKVYWSCGSGAGCGSGSGSGLGEGSGSTTSNPIRCISIIINNLTTYLIALQSALLICYYWHFIKLF
jgi:hypothetical protein